jgi:hypothetical protein
MKPVVSVTEAGPFHPQIAKLIYLVRGHRVLLDSDLANLYGVETGALVRAMHRNAERFPEDFVLQLSEEEVLRCQIGISRGRHGGRRYLPYAFTEQGVAMLSSVLRSERAVQVNVEIMRAFVRLRQLVSTNAELARKMDELERKYDGQFNKRSPDREGDAARTPAHAGPKCTPEKAMKRISAPAAASRRPVGASHPLSLRLKCYLCECFEDGQKDAIVPRSMTWRHA